MSTRSVVPRLLRLALFVSILALFAQLFPSQPAQAAVFQRTLGNTTREFSTGRFQRTSLALLRSNNSSLVPIDQDGAVQLAPIGLLKDWTDATFNMTTTLSFMGATSIGNRIFVIGGRRYIDDVPTPLAEVRSVAINLVTGNTASEWEAEPDLPKVQNSQQSPFNGEIAEIEAPAIATVDNPTGNDYIYVIGGTFSFGTVSLSSFAVRRATVGSNGRISSWQNMANAKVPSDDPDRPNLSFGLGGAAATTFKAANGKTYIYLLGGLQRYCEGGASCSTRVVRGLRTVYYAEVASDGRLLKPGTTTEGWTLLQNTPIPIENTDTLAGLWDSVAVADRFPDSGDGLFLIGGQEVPDTNSSAPVFSNVVYRAQLGPNGGLSWITPTGSGSNYTLPTARFGHGGVLFNGSIYLTGGQPSQDFPATDKAVLTSYVTGTLELPNIGIGGSQFLDNDALPNPISHHGTVLVKASEASTSSAFIYLLGGYGSPLDSIPDDLGTSKVIFGRIGGSEDIETDGYVPDGSFTSLVEPISFDNAEVQKINWTTQITREGGISGMDIAFDYRTSLDADCNAPTWTDADWKPLAVSASIRSNSGNNSKSLTNLKARCFQYRVLLKGSSGLKTAHTPSLLGVSIEIFIPGSPDLKVKELTAKFNQKTFTGMKTVIENRYTGGSDPTLNADVEGPGQFYVDLVVFAPGQTPVKPTIPINPSSPNAKGYVRIDKSTLPSQASYEITSWCSGANDQSCQPLKWTDVFAKVGTYTVYVVVDSYCPPSATGCVNESLNGAEANNVSGAVQVVIKPKDDTCTGPDCDPDVEPDTPKLYLPMVSK